MNQHKLSQMQKHILRFLLDGHWRTNRDIILGIGMKYDPKNQASVSRSLYRLHDRQLVQNPWRGWAITNQGKNSQMTKRANG